MEIEYKGANSLTLKQGSNAYVVINPKLSEFGLKDLKIAEAIELVHEQKYAVEGEPKILIQGPGEYEVSNVSIKGVSATKYDDSDAKLTVYKLEMDGVRCAVLGDISPSLDDSQLEAIGVIDVLAIPVGGSSVTLSPHEAAKIVNQIDPRVVIPMHYADKGVQYENAQEELKVFLKELGAQEYETVEKLKIKNAALPAARTVYQIQRSA